MWENYKIEVLDKQTYKKPHAQIDAMLPAWPSSERERVRSSSPIGRAAGAKFRGSKPPSPGGASADLARTAGAGTGARGAGARGVQALRNSRSDSALQYGAPGVTATTAGGTSYQDLEDKVESWVTRRQDGGTRSASTSPKRRKRKGAQDPVTAAKRYTRKRVDPVMREVINFLLREQPEHADVAM